MLVNNAQQVPTGPLDECTDDDMYTAWESGALAAFRLMQLCHPLMTARGGGAIVNLAFGCGNRGPRRVGRVRGGQGRHPRAHEGGDARVGCRQHPGQHDLPVGPQRPLGRLDDRQRAARLRRNPLRRIGDPEADIGGVVVFLAGDAGSYVTGQTIHVDGGNMAFR